MGGKGRRVAVAGLLAAGAAAGAFVLYALWYTAGDRIIPGVSVNGQPLGGLTRAQAGELLGRPAALLPPSPAPTLVWGEREWVLPPAPASEPDQAGMLEAAWRLGRRGGMSHRLRDFARGLVGGHHLSGPVPGQSRTVLPATWQTEIARIAAELRQEPVDADFDPDSGTWVGGLPGRELDQAATLAALQEGLQAGRLRVQAVVRPVAPRVQAGTAEAARRVLARFETPILAADPGRVANIALGARKINGLVLQPGQVFSFNREVGPRDPQYGWQQARELYQGEYVLGYGGGICQLSSTLYNAVLLVGLQVVERHHHSRPLSYVEPGRDATVAWDYLDFKFRNSGPGPVVIAAGLTGRNPQRVQVTLYGPWQPEPATLETVREEYLPPPLLEVPDASLAPGERVVVEQGYEGYRIRLDRITAAGRATVARAFYPPKAGRVLIGTGVLRPLSQPGNQLRE